MQHFFLPARRPQQATASRSPALASAPLRWGFDELAERLFEDTFSAVARSAPWMPVDLTETNEGFTVRIEVPGVDPSALEVQLVGDLLSIRGHKESKHGSEQEPQFSERSYGEFQRSIRLPCPVDSESVKAEHKHGVLTISIQKAQAQRAKRIQVDSAG